MSPESWAIWGSRPEFQDFTERSGSQNGSDRFTLVLQKRIKVFCFDRRFSQPAFSPFDLQVEHHRASHVSCTARGTPSDLCSAPVGLYSYGVSSAWRESGRSKFCAARPKGSAPMVGAQDLFGSLVAGKPGISCWSTGTLCEPVNGA